MSYQVPPEWRFHRRFEFLTADDHPQHVFWRNWLATHPAPGMPQPAPAPPEVSMDYPRAKAGSEWKADRVLVVSRYREQLHWLRDVPMPVALYNKGPAVTRTWDHVTITDLPNVQRESGTMLHYIVTHYDDLPDRVLFCQGWPFDHSPDFLDRIVVDWEVPTPLTIHYLPDKPEQWIKDRDRVWTSQGYECRMGDARIQAHPGQPRWFDDAAWHYLFDAPIPQPMWFGYGATFSVPRDSILSRPIEFWRHLLSACDSGGGGSSHTEPSPINPWSLEALWHYIWQGVEYPHRSGLLEPMPPVVVQSSAPRRKGCGCGKLPRAGRSKAEIASRIKSR